MLHEDELPVDAGMVERLVADQFAEWADEPVAEVDSEGTSNWIFLLGRDKYIRLRRRPAEPSKVEAEQRWLEHLAPHLPARIPRVLGRGRPGEGYPLPWTVLDWLPGEPATLATVDGPGLAVDLAGFVTAMRAVDATGGPPPNDDNNWRACPLAWRDDSVKKALLACDGLVDVEAAAEAWARAMAAPVWDGPPTFVHGDLMAGNLLVEDGRLSGVIDYGCLAVGDPANDVMTAWAVLDPDGRRIFRDALDVDDATWARGAGWALSVALIALPYYQHTHPGMTRQNRYLIDQVLCDDI